MTTASTLSRAVTVSGENGLHLVPCSRISATAGRFQSELVIRKGDRVANARSPLDLMTLGAAQGTKLTIDATGSDAAAAIEAITRLFEANFELESNQD